MKKYVFGPIVCAITIFACQKNVIEPTVETKNENQTRASLLLDDRWYDRTWLDPQEYGCEPKPGRCLMTVVVTSTSISPAIVSGVISIIETGTPNQIITAFSNEETDLKTLMPGYLVDGVISGEYVVSSKGIFGQGSTAFVQFYETNGTLERVVRLTE